MAWRFGSVGWWQPGWLTVNPHSVSSAWRLASSRWGILPWRAVSVWCGQSLITSRPSGVACRSTCRRASISSACCPSCPSGVGVPWLIGRCSGCVHIRHRCGFVLPGSLVDFSGTSACAAAIEWSKLFPAGSLLSMAFDCSEEGRNN